MYVWPATRGEAMELQYTEQGIQAPLAMLEIDEGFNIRRDPQPSPELLKSIKEVGIIEPLHVRTKDGDEKRLFVVNGERRYYAAEKLGIEFVPIVNEGEIETPDALVVAMTSQNNSPYSDREMAAGVKRLNDAGVALDQMAKILGKSSRSISEYYKVITQGCPELIDSDIPARVAARIAEFEVARQIELIELVKGLTREEALVVLRDAETELENKKPGKKTTPDPISYPMVKKPRVVLEEFEKGVLKGLKADRKSERLRGMRDAIDVMKGAKSVKDILK